MTEADEKKRGPLFYTLLTVVLGVWGYVFVQLTTGVEDHHEVAAVTEVQAATVPAAEIRRRDRWPTYAAGYRDPFVIPSTLVPPVRPPAGSKKEKAATPRPPAPDPPRLTLQGVFEQTALLEDKYRLTHLVTSGDSVGEARVADVRAETVVLAFQGSTFELNLHP